MLEMADAGECHRDVVFVGCGDRLIVFDRTTGLDDRRDAKSGGFVNVIAKREERI